jgi:hypothetical protein
VFKPYDQVGPSWARVEEVIVIHRMLQYFCVIISMTLASPALVMIAICVRDVDPANHICTREGVAGFFVPITMTCSYMFLYVGTSLTLYCWCIILPPSWLRTVFPRALAVFTLCVIAHLITLLAYSSEFEFGCPPRVPAYVIVWGAVDNITFALTTLSVGVAVAQVCSPLLSQSSGYSLGPPLMHPTTGAGAAASADPRRRVGGAAPGAAGGVHGGDRHACLQLLCHHAGPHPLHLPQLAGRGARAGDRAPPGRHPSHAHQQHQ